MGFPCFGFRVYGLGFRVEGAQGMKGFRNIQGFRRCCGRFGLPWDPKCTLETERSLSSPKPQTSGSGV